MRCCGGNYRDHYFSPVFKLREGGKKYESDRLADLQVSSYFFPLIIRIRQQKEESQGLNISFFMYICRHFAIKVAAFSKLRRT